MKPASDKATEMINHVGVTNVARHANRRIPVPHKYPPGDLNLGPLWREANRKSTGPVRHGENEVRLQALNMFLE
jgi:hypothetical protein